MGKPLGDGLYEFRIRRSLRALEAADSPGDKPGADTGVLLRIFCTFHGNKVVLLYHGYNKKQDPSAKRQAREIRKARALHERWKRDKRH